MDSVDEQAKDAQRSSGTGPGDRLQAARIEKGISLDDVAKRMHLSSSIVEAIEENHFEEITAPIFVKGYLRAYARIVSLDEDDMIDQYIDFYSGEDPPISSTSNVASELSVADARVKWTTYIVVLIVGVSLAAWLWNREQGTEAPISLDTQTPAMEDGVESDVVASSEIEAVSEESMATGESDEATDDQPAAVTSTEVEPESMAAQQPAAEAAEAAAGEVVEADVVASEVVETDVVENEVAEAQAARVEASEAEASEAEVVTTESTEDEAVEAETGSLQTTQVTRNEPSRIAPAGTDKVNLVVHADTWADIKDANSYQLVYDLLRADEAVELIGQAPFSIFLGNGHGVEIMFNGEEIDVAPRVRDDNTARLRIGR